MNTIIDEMLKKYTLNNATDKKNAIKEIVQEIVLSGLYRAGFFNVAAFYGGTALRIFYGLDRFSEDLDFSLLKKDENFDFKQYFSVLDAELKTYGLNMEIALKEKINDSNIKSAFVKGNTKEMILYFCQDELSANKIIDNEMIKIKFEVDTNPADYATYETKYRVVPTIYSAKLYDESSLFAGKIHAVLCRAWKNRIKGRDLYDYVFYIQHNCKINIKNLREKLIQSSYINVDDQFDINILKEHLYKRFEQIDYENAKLDVVDLINNKKDLDLWTADFFKAITKNIEENKD